ncbi:MAG: heme NO-binding domain-containing protein [Candidatus Binatia bacterium]|nr:heme NO-binding domain-containing protein [Candidatus Binatia bacterium]
MYGLINRAVRELVLGNYGADAWNAIRTKASVEEDDFVSMQSYDDDVTYALVSAASEHLGVPAEQILETFGEYWVKYVGDDSYGELMNAAGMNLPDFLLNLDQMHARVMLTFPDLKPPSFKVTDQTEDSLRLHYFSKRVGLAPLVVGLLNGLALRFETTIEVTHGRDGADGAEHDVFDILMETRPIASVDD